MAHWRSISILKNMVNYFVSILDLQNLTMKTTNTSSLPDASVFLVFYPCMYAYVCMCLWWGYGGWGGWYVWIGLSMTYSTFILIYKAGREHHHWIASSFLLYYTAFVFILLPSPGWIHYRFPMGPWGTTGWQGRNSEHASSLGALVLFLASEYHHGIVIIPAMGHICRSSAEALVIRKTIVPCCSGSCFSITNRLNYFVEFREANISAEKSKVIYGCVWNPGFDYLD